METTLTKKSGLIEYYNNIPEATAPKTKWLEMVAKELEVSVPTVRAWVNGRNKPSHPAFYRKLSKITGIPENELFKD